jgi:hypothetical protein
MVLLLVLGVAVVVTQGSFATQHDGQSGEPPGALSTFSDRINPSPEHPPERVVAIQLEAMRLNDEANRGIAVAFRFASPANKAMTGPLPRFAFMIRNGPYRPMLDYQTALYDPVVVVDGHARQRVTLLGRMGAIGFVFHLSRQVDGPWQDCWMTDAVTVEPVEGKQV